MVVIEWILGAGAFILTAGIIGREKFQKNPLLMAIVVTLSVATTVGSFLLLKGWLLTLVDERIQVLDSPRPVDKHLPGVLTDSSHDGSHPSITGPTTQYSEPKKTEPSTSEIAEHSAWQIALNSDSIASFEGYLSKYPNGAYVDSARANVARLKSNIPAFQDCSDCPVMVPIKPGSFIMGEQPGDELREDVQQAFRGRSGPQHRVTIGYAFAVAKYDVTRTQFMQFVRETGYRANATCFVIDDVHHSGIESGHNNWEEPGYRQTPSDPVVCVSWLDASRYAAWLAQRTGKPYRLLSEAEWEYAARGGALGVRWWGDSANAGCTFENIADLDAKSSFPSWDFAYCGDGYVFTSPVGRYSANGFGLYDMLGNVWQWTKDCWNANYTGAPTNGAAWEAGDCDRHVKRGGSWASTPSWVRLGGRYMSPAQTAGTDSGFRVALTL